MVLYLRLPPPPREPPPREPPKLDDPRLLLARALLPLKPPEPPLKALELRDPPPPPEVLRFPTRSPPLRSPLLALRSLAPGWRSAAPPARSEFPLEPRSVFPACCLPPNCPWFWRALSRRFAIESPRAVPPYLLA